MTVLSMARPWKHPKTGGFYFRLSIPSDLRPFAKGGPEEPTHEYKRSLHTKDARIAKRLYADVAAKCGDYLEELRARRDRVAAGALGSADVVGPKGSDPPKYSQKALAGFAAELGHEILNRHASDPGPKEAFALNSSCPPGPWGTRVDPWAGLRFMLTMARRSRLPASEQQAVRVPAQKFVEARTLKLSGDAWDTFCGLARDAIDAALEALQRRYRGDLSDSSFKERFPLDSAPALRPKVSITGLAEVWAKVRSATKQRSLKKYQRRLREFSEFLKHDDALSLAPKDLRAWRDDLKAKGRTVKTINDDCVGVVLTVFRVAASEEVLPTFPFPGSYALKKEASATRRRPYEDDEAGRVLAASRKEKSAALRWTPWLMAYTGARIGELAQLRPEDVKARGKIPFISITDQGQDQSAKTESSVRDVPLHPVLVREGFLKFVASVRHGEFLFRDLAGKSREQRADSGSRVYMRWLRKTVGIKDPRIVGHSWRHRMEDELREVDAPEEVAAAITGRTRQGSRALYGKGPSLVTKARWLKEVAAIKLA